MTLVACDAATRVFSGNRRAVDSVSFTAGAGEIIGIVGPNGAGKTTLLRVLAGDLTLTAGAASAAGSRCGTRVARAAVGFATDPPLAPPELTGLEWLRYLASHAATRARDRLDLIRSAIEMAALEDFVGRRIGEYSRGMAQRLALAAATMGYRRVVLLDETLGGIDPLVARSLRHQISRFAAGGRLVVVASHDLATIELLATRALVMLRGRLVADVSMASLLAERVMELALSGGALAGADWLVQRFRGSVRTGEGVAIPLLDGLTGEHVMEACRGQRVAVAGSRIRYRRLEDILVAESGGSR